LKNRTITVTDTVINSGVATLYNATMVITSTGQYDAPATPKRIYFVNGTGEDIEFNVLTKSEIREYNVSSTGFVGVIIPNGSTFRHHEIYGRDSLENVYYILVKGQGSSATTDLTVYLLDYI